MATKDRTFEIKFKPIYILSKKPVLIPNSKYKIRWVPKPGKIRRKNK